MTSGDEATSVEQQLIIGERLTRHKDSYLRTVTRESRLDMALSDPTYSDSGRLAWWTANSVLET